MTDSVPATAKDYLTRAGLDAEHARQVLARCGHDGVQQVTDVQAHLAHDSAASCADAAWLRWCVEHAYKLPLPDADHPLMPAALPLRRQHMTPQPMQRAIGRRLLAFLLYRPAATVLRHLQVLTGRVERT